MRVFVNVLEILFVNVLMGVRISVMAVFMFVLYVLMVMQGVRVGVRHIPVRVFMGVLFHHMPHYLPFVLDAETHSLRGGFGLLTRYYTSRRGLWQVFPISKLMRLTRN